MESKSEKIAALNDQFRQEIAQPKKEVPGEFLMTAGINSLSDEQKLEIIKQVIAFDDFTEDNDPYGEHDFGVLDLDGLDKIYWKFDYYDNDLKYGSENPADPTITKTGSNHPVCF